MSEKLDRRPRTLRIKVTVPRYKRMYIARVRLRMGVDGVSLLEREQSTQNLYPGEQGILTPSAARILWTRIFTGKSCVNPEVRISRPYYAMSEI